jgi:hypothetical protein
MSPGSRLPEDVRMSGLLCVSVSPGRVCAAGWPGAFVSSPLHTKPPPKSSLTHPMATTSSMLATLLLAASRADALPATGCATVEDIVLGFNSRGEQLKAKTAAECCDLCKTHEALAGGSCKSWTFHTTGGACWLHDAIGPSHKEKGVISGVTSATLPPIPPPSPPSHHDSGMGVPSGPDACTPGTNGTAFKFCDHSLSMDARLDDLIERVQVDEIALELTARQSEPIDRLGVPSYYWVRPPPSRRLCCACSVCARSVHVVADPGMHLRGFAGHQRHPRHAERPVSASRARWQVSDVVRRPGHPRRELQHVPRRGHGQRDRQRAPRLLQRQGSQLARHLVSDHQHQQRSALGPERGK